MKRPQSSQPEADAGIVDLSERNWLPRYCRGDVRAFDELLLAYRKLVCTFLYRYGIAADRHDDLFQDIFLKIHQSASRYRPNEPLRPWVVSIVLNTVRNSRRDSGRRRHAMTHLKSMTERSASEGPASQQYGPGPGERLDQQTTVKWLQGCITTLPDIQREVLVLSTLKGLRMKDIANVMALPENTVKTHLRRARLVLAESLACREALPDKPQPNSQGKSHEE